MKKLLALLLLSVLLAAQNVTRITGNPGDPFSVPTGGVNGLSVNADGSVNASKGLTWANATKPTFGAGATTTCDFSLSNLCEIDFGAGNTTLAFTNAHGSGPYWFRSCQDAVGGRIYTATINIIGMAQPSPGAGTTVCTEQVFSYDGSNLQAGAVASCPTCTGTFMFGPTRAAPGTSPPSGNLFCWFDSTDNTQECRDSSGNVTRMFSVSTLNANVPWNCAPTGGAAVNYDCNGVMTRTDGTAIGSTEPKQGQVLTMIFNNTNTGSFTIKTGAVAITAVNYIGETFPASSFFGFNDTAQFSSVTFKYSATDNEWILENMPKISAGTGMTVTKPNGYFEWRVALTNPVTSTNGGHGADLSAAAAHSTVISNGASPAVYSAKTIPDCIDTGGNHLNFTQSTDAFSCGTSGGGTFNPLDPTVAYGRDEFIHSGVIGVGIDIGDMRWQNTTTFGGNTSTYITGTTDHNGIFKLSTTIATSTVALSFQNTSGGVVAFGPVNAIPASGSWQFDFVVNPVSFSGGMEYDVGLDAAASGSTISGTNTVIARALQGTDTNWTLRTCVAGPTCTTAATTTPIVANKYALLSIKSSAAGTIVLTATQNGVSSTASSSTNIPTVGLMPWMVAVNGGATTTVELDVDLFVYYIAGLVRF